MLLSPGYEKLAKAILTTQGQLNEQEPLHETVVREQKDIQQDGIATVVGVGVAAKAQG